MECSAARWQTLTNRRLIMRMMSQRAGPAVFLVAHIRDNFLLTPEFVKVHKAGEYEWRGEIHKVDYP